MRTAILLIMALCCSGCAAITNPVANGIPVRLLPRELLAESQESKVDVPLTMLRRETPDVERLGPGDILGVYIEGVLGQRDQLPPLSIPEGDNPPALGFPIAVRPDGTIPLPLIRPPLNVNEMTITEAEEAVTRAYTVDRDLLPDESTIILTLIRRRTVRVLVIRQDSPGSSGLSIQSSGPLNRSRLGGVNISSSGNQGVGQVVELPAYENDVLNALTRTGGLPGANAVNEVLIQRGAYDGSSPDSFGLPGSDNSVRIPLRIDPNQPPPFSPEDIVLNTGDVVYIAGRDAELYYTGGLLPTAEIPLPRDFDLDVVEAVIRVNGPLVNGGINSNNLSGSIVSSGLGNPSPSQLTVIRRLKDGRQVNIQVDLNRALQDPRERILIQSGDMLILQETPGEAFARYATSVISLNFFFDLFERADGVGTATLGLP